MSSWETIQWNVLNWHNALCNTIRLFLIVSYRNSINYWLKNAIAIEFPWSLKDAYMSEHTYIFKPFIDGKCIPVWLNSQNTP
jgi:hypothetical protein